MLRAVDKRHNVLENKVAHYNQECIIVYESMEIYNATITLASLDKSLESIRSLINCSSQLKITSSK